MPRFERFDIVAVPFPYVERPIRQRRPALVVASDFGAPHDLLWVLMITAAGNPPWPDDVEIDDHRAGGLPIPSRVRTAKIATIAAETADRIGALPARHATRVTTILRARLA